MLWRRPQSWAHATINVQLTGASWTERVAQLPTPSVRTCCNSQICGKTHSGTMCRHGNYEVPGGDSQDTPPASSAAPKTTEHHQHSHVRVADGHIGPLRARPPPPRLGARAAHSSNEQSYVPNSASARFNHNRITMRTPPSVSMPEQHGPEGGIWLCKF